MEQGNTVTGAVLSADSWLQWLEEHRSFSFQGRNGQINVLKEKRSRGGSGYWYAYQRQGKQMLKRYIGRSDQLSIEYLEELASSLRLGRISNVPAQVDASVQFEPLLMSKLQLPHIQKSLLRREQLLQTLDKSLDYRLTVISGPAGYGKTTAVAQWVTERRALQDFPYVSYIALDEDDNDPIRFWRYIIAAFQQFQADFGKEVLELLRANRLPPFKPLDLMLTVLLNELVHLSHSCILILDEFHKMSSPYIRDTLGFFLDHLPTSFHVFLLVRGKPLLSLMRMRARNALLDIYPPLLGFSLEEARAFFKQELPFSLSEKLLRQIYERLEGWPAGIRLLVGTLRLAENEQEVERILAAFTGGFWSLEDYFSQEVLSTLPEELQAFLLQTSILPRLTADLCDTVLERNGSARLLEALYSGDLFLVPLDATGAWGRYQALFAEVIQQEARKRLGVEKLRSVSASASVWYEQHGYDKEAIETALNASAFPRSAQLIQLYIENEQHAHKPILPLSTLYDLKRWLEQIPEEELECRPELCLYYAMALLFLLMEDPRSREQKERIEQLLHIAEQHWRETNNTAKLAEIFSFRSLLARQEGRMQQAMTWAKQAMPWLPSKDRVWRTVALTEVGLGEIVEGDLKNARKYLLEALILNEQQGNHVYARASRGMLSWVSMELGELHHAAEQFHQMQAEARAQKDDDDIAHSQLGLAQIAYQWNNLEDARQAAQEVLEIGDRLAIDDFHAQATARLALIEHADGQTAQAKQRLQAWFAGRTIPATQRGYHLYREIQAVLMQMHLAVGDLLTVERWFERIEQREESVPLLQHQREQLLKARLLLAQGDTHTVLGLLGPLSAAAQQTGHLTLQREAQVILSLAYCAEGRREQGQQQLLELLTATRSENYLRLYIDQGQAMAEQVRNLLPRLSEKMVQAYARRILNAFDRGTGASSVQAQAIEVALVEPLSAQEQKVLRLLATGNSNAEIARELVVSVNTIRTQVQSIYRKLNVNNRVEASAVARRSGLL